MAAASIAHAISINPRAIPCSCDNKITAMKQEIATIRSHTLNNANKIPLTPTAPRTFFVT